MRKMRLMATILVAALCVGCSSDKDNETTDNKQLISVVENGEEFKVDFKYDTQGRLTEFAMDDYGDEITYSFQYSDSQIIHTEESQWGNETTIYTLKDGKIISKKDISNRITEYTYEGNRIKQIVNDGDYTTDFTWENGNIVKAVEKSSETHTFTYSDISHRFVYMSIDIFNYLENGGSFIDNILFQLGYFGECNKSLPVKGQTVGKDSSKQTCNYTLDNGMVSKVVCTDYKETLTYELTYQTK